MTPSFKMTEIERILNDAMALPSINNGNPLRHNDNLCRHQIVILLEVVIDAAPWCVVSELIFSHLYGIFRLNKIFSKSLTCIYPKLNVGLGFLLGLFVNNVTQLGGRGDVLFVLHQGIMIRSLTGGRGYGNS